MICYVVSFCLRHLLTPPYARGVFAYATHLEALLTPPAYATLRSWSFRLRTGRYDMTLTKHAHGGFGRCSLGALGAHLLNKHLANAHKQPPADAGHILVDHV